MSVQEFKSEDEYKQIVNSGDVVVIDFTATWCGPCRVISPIFEKISQDERYTGVKFYKVDVDQWPGISSAAGVRAMPTFMVFKAGEKVKELVGAVPPKLEELIVHAATLVEAQA